MAKLSGNKPRTGKRGRVELPDHPTLYKVLNHGRAPQARNFTWPLPTKGGPGEWVEIPDDQQLIACQQGLHFFDAAHAEFWIQNYGGSDVYEAEVEGELIQHSSYPYDSRDHKWVARRARLVRRIGSPPSTYPRDAWWIENEMGRRAQRRYERFWKAYTFRRLPAWIVKLIGPDKDFRPLKREYVVLKAKAKVERAKYDLAKLLSQPDTAAAKARRRSIRRRADTISALLNWRYPYNPSYVLKARWLGVKMTKEREVRLHAAKQARLERAIEREKAQVTLPQWIEENLA